MKRRIVAVMLLLLYVLAACTLLSRKIEKEMLLQVEIRPLGFEALRLGGGAELPPNYLFWDETGLHLYEIIEGTGWESGPRVREIGSEYFRGPTAAGTVFLSGLDQCNVISLTSRQPSPGELAVILDQRVERPRVEDQILVYYPNGTPEGWKEEGTILARSDTAVLLADERSEPYFEREKVGDYVLQTQTGWRIFSLDTVRHFWSQLPLAALVGVLAICGAVMWIFAVCSVGRAPGAGRGLGLPLAVSVVSLGAMAFLLNRISFPPSTLPPSNILDVNYYRAEWQTVRTALASLPGGLERLLPLVQTVQRKSALIAGGGALSLAVLLGAQWRLCRK